MPTDGRTVAEGPVDQYLAGAFKTINAHVPRRRKSLAALLAEDRPHIVCSDGSRHSFKKTELALLAGMMDEEEASQLMLPLLIEVSSERGEYALSSPRETEAKILSKLLDSRMEWRMNKVALYGPHLLQIRRVLKTCCQYVFVP